MARKKHDAQTPEAAEVIGKRKRAPRSAKLPPMPLLPQLPFVPDAEPAVAPAPAVSAAEPEIDVLPSPSPTALAALHDGLTAVVLRVVGRLGARAARAATTRLRELLTRWAAAQPPAIRELCLGYVLAVGPAITRADRSRDGIELNLTAFGPLADAALGVAGGRMARDALVEFGATLVRGLVEADDARGPERLLEDLRTELRFAVDRRP